MSKWEVKTIGEIATSIISGGLPSKTENSSEGNTPIIKLRDINQVKSPYIHKCKSYIDIRECSNKRVFE